MSDAVQKIIWIGVSIAAALAASAIMWGQLSESSDQIEDTPLVDYEQISNQAICEGAGGVWTDGATTPCQAPGSSTPARPPANTLTTQAACEGTTPPYTWTPGTDQNGDGDTEDVGEGTCA